MDLCCQAHASSSLSQQPAWLLRRQLATVGSCVVLCRASLMLAECVLLLACHMHAGATRKQQEEEQQEQAKQDQEQARAAGSSEAAVKQQAGGCLF